MSGQPESSDRKPGEASRIIPIFEGTCLLTFDTAERSEVPERFYEFCEWISDQHMGGSRGFRFIDGFAWPTNELRSFRGIDMPWGQPYESWVGPAPNEMKLRINVPALNETQAMARFLGFVDTVSALLEFGESRVGLVKIIPETKLSRGKDSSIPKNLEDLFFRFAEDWFDSENDGAFDEEHIRSAIMVDTHRALFPSTEVLMTR